MDLHLITHLIFTKIPVTIISLENIHQKSHLFLHQLLKNALKLLKINKITYILQTKGVRPIVPLEVGYKLAYSSSFDTNISNVQ